MQHFTSGVQCLHYCKFKIKAEAKKVILKYIEVFYNRIRRYAKIKNQIPAQFAQA
jgi:transposase InsO family protein